MLTMIKIIIIIMKTMIIMIMLQFFRKGKTNVNMRVAKMYKSLKKQQVEIC